MASSKQIRDEIMRMTIVVNSNEGQQEIYNLKKANDTLAQSIADLEKQKAALGRRNKANGEEYDKLKQQIKDNTLAMEANRDKMEKLRGELDLSQMTMGQLRKEADLLKRQLKDVIPGTQPAIELQNQLNRVNERMGVVRRGADEASFSFKNLAERFNHYSGLVTAMVAILVGFGISVQSVIDRNNKMADAMSGVEKTTGLTRKEVESLTKTFADFDSRTKNIDLLKIAEVGGRLGVAKSEIADFTREVDKAYVALGDSWSGGVDKLADSLGRIASLYGETKDLPIADSINMIGSALNELAAQGASSEQNIADFVTRLGSMPPAMKPALNTLLGFGSAFEESGINSEIASSGFAKFIRVASNNAEGFAQVMRKPVKEVKDLINSDPAEFFLQFSEGLKGLEGTELQNVLDKLKLSDNEVQRVIGAATEKTERFRDSVELANQAVEDGTSLQEEFAKVNNNAAAVYEKVQKKLGALFTSSGVAKSIEFLTRQFALFIGVSEDAEGELGVLGKTVLNITRVFGILLVSTVSVSAAIVAYNLLVKESIHRQIALEAITKLRTITNQIATAGQSALNVAVGLGGKVVASLTQAIGYQLGITKLQTTAINMQASAQARLNSVTNANAIGLVISLIGLAVTAYLSYKAVVDDTAKSVQNYNTIIKAGAENAAEEVSKLKLLYNAATDESLSRDKRIKAIQKLKSEYPSYFSKISDEIIMNGKAKQSYEELTNAIIASARADAARDELKKREADRLKRDAALQAEIERETKQRNEYKARVLAGEDSKTLRMDGGDGKSFVQKLNYDDLLTASRKRLQGKLNEQEGNELADKMADKFYVGFIASVDSKTTKYQNDKNKGISVSNYDTSGDPDKSKNEKGSSKPTKDSEVEAFKRLKEEMLAEGNKLNADFLQQESDLRDSKIELMEAGSEKELAILEQELYKQRLAINKNINSEDDYKKIDEVIAKVGDKEKAIFEEIKRHMLISDSRYNQLELDAIDKFEVKKKALKAKHENENIKDRDEAFQESLKRLKRQENEEIASYSSLQEMKAGLKGRMDDKELSKIRTWEDGKKAVNKIYQQQELEMLANHLQEMVAMYEGLDLSILNEEQKEEVTKRLEEVRDKVAEVAAKKQDLANGEQGKEGSKLGKLKGGGNTDILGMSPDQWDTFFDNLKTGTDAIGTVGAAIQALQSAFSTYYSFVQAKEQAQAAQIDRSAKVREKRLKTMLDRGQINQEEYEQQMQLLQEETDKKKAKLEYESAKRQRAMQIGQIIANTAIAIMNAATTQPFLPLGLAMTGVAAGLGALQLATVLSTPLPEAPGFEDGFGMDYDMRRQQDGKKFRVTRKPLTSGEVHSPTHFIAAEKGTELVIDSPTYTRFRPEVKSILRNEIAYSRGFEGGYYPYLSQKEPSVEMSASSAPGSSYSDAVIERNTEALNKVAEMKPRAYIVKDMSFAKDIIEVTDEYNSYKNSARK